MPNILGLTRIKTDPTDFKSQILLAGYMDMDISPNLKLRIYFGAFTPLSVARRASSSPALSPSNQVVSSDFVSTYFSHKAIALKAFLSDNKL
ncbi:hypothetical protein H5410_032823 [Solanum commersonii]|uniref:Uncharacterized protein n=1 Tax=Solanum commersonii TaxID=4109 RepID=A0A9J5YND1_SOLCO|nr:hypothetical protein H5410_032823 [Solanum commersonii]